LVNNARINLQSIGTAVNDPPIETRVKNGILAQVKTNGNIQILKLLQFTV
jgi:hypothetical protein